MKYLIFSLAFVTVFISWASAQPAAATDSNVSSTQQSLIASSTSVLEAEKTKQPAALTKLLAHDFLQVGSDGHTHGAEEVMEAAREGTLRDYQIYEARVVSIDDNNAIVTYNSVIRMPEGDSGQAPRYQHISDFWVKQGDSWKLKFQQSTPLRFVE